MILSMREVFTAEITAVVFPICVCGREAPLFAHLLPFGLWLPPRLRVLSPWRTILPRDTFRLLRG